MKVYAKTYSGLLMMAILILIVALLGCESEPAAPPAPGAPPAAPARLRIAPAPKNVLETSRSPEQTTTDEGAVDVEQAKAKFTASVKNKLNTSQEAR